jgi:hypothetical protein
VVCQLTTVGALYQAVMNTLAEFLFFTLNQSIGSYVPQAAQQRRREWHRSVTELPDHPSDPALAIC